MSTHATDSIITPEKMEARRLACELDCQIDAIKAIQRGLEGYKIYRSDCKWNGTYLTKFNAVPVLQRYVDVGYHVIFCKHPERPDSGEIRFVISATGPVGKRETESMLYAMGRTETQVIEVMEPRVIKGF